LPTTLDQLLHSPSFTLNRLFLAAVDGCGHRTCMRGHKNATQLVQQRTSHLAACRRSNSPDISCALCPIHDLGRAFAYHDNEYFVETAAGRSLPLMIWPDIRRYFPLQLREFNLLRRISPTALFYQSVLAVQLVVFCWLLLIALARTSLCWRVGAVLLLLCTNSIAIVFADPIYPERNIVFAMALFAIAVQRFDRDPSRLNFLERRSQPT
jgi:hypothetical protein